MLWGQIHRMIMRELVKIFFLALISLTGLILVAGVISEAMKNGLGPWQILAIIPVMVPSLLPYTVPTTTLFTTCIVYGRLSADNEILALKAAGIHIGHVVWPAMCLGLITTAATMVFFLEVIPYTGYLLRNPAFGEVEELLYAMLRKDGRIVHPKINYEIFVKSVQGRKLLDAQFMRRAPAGSKVEYDVVARANEAELHVHKNKVIEIDMAMCHFCDSNNGNIGFFERKIVPVEIMDFSASRNKVRAADMTWFELFEYRDKAILERKAISDQIDITQVQRMGQPPDADVRRQLEDRRLRDEFIRVIQAEMYWRPALALGCLCFVLVGCPVGIWFSKSDYLSAFITCFLPIVVIYYPLMFCLLNLGKAEKLPPWTGVFIPDAILMLIGGILFHRLARN